jgi:hypothetical protein
MNIAAADRSAVTKNSDAPTPMSTFGDAPVATVSTADDTQSVISPTPSPAAARAAAPARVVRPARNSSHRPASSSPRVTRVATSSPQIAPRMITVIPVL